MKDDKENNPQYKRSAILIAERLRVNGSKWIEQEEKTLKPKMDMVIHVMWSGALFVRNLVDVDHAIGQELAVPRRGMDSICLRNTRGLITFYCSTPQTYNLYLTGPTPFGSRDLTACVPKAYQSQGIQTAVGRLGLMDDYNYTLRNPSDMYYYLNDAKTAHRQRENISREMEDAHIIRQLMVSSVKESTKYHGSLVSGDYAAFLQRNLSIQCSYWARFNCDLYYLVNYLAANSGNLYRPLLEYNKVRCVDGSTIILNSDQYKIAGQSKYIETTEQKAGEAVTCKKVHNKQWKEFPIAFAARKIISAIGLMLGEIVSLLPSIHSPGLMAHYFFKQLRKIGDHILEASGQLWKNETFTLMEKRISVLGRCKNLKDRKTVLERRKEKQELDFLQKCWKNLLIGVDILQNSFRQAMEITAYTTHMLAIDRQVPEFDMPTTEELQELINKDPVRYAFRLCREQIKKYLNLGTVGKFALATTFVPFDFYAFQDQYALMRGVPHGMVMSPVNCMRRLSYEYRVNVTTNPSLVNMFDMRNIKEGGIDVPTNSQVYVSPEVVNTVAHPLEGVIAIWQQALGSSPSVIIDKLINRDAREGSKEGSHDIVRRPYVIDANAPWIVSIQSFQQQQEDKTSWSLEMFRKVYTGTLHFEDVVYLTTQLRMVNGYYWLERMAWLQDKYPFKMEMQINHLLQTSRKVKRERAVNTIQRTVRKRFAFRLKRLLVLQRWVRVQLERRRSVSLIRRKTCAATYIARWYLKSKRRKKLVVALDLRINKLHAIMNLLDYFFSPENLATDEYLKTSIRRQPHDLVPYVPYAIIQSFPSILQYLVGESVYGSSSALLVRAASCLPGLIALSDGITTVLWEQEAKRATWEYHEQERYYQQYMREVYRHPQLRYPQQPFYGFQ